MASHSRTNNGRKSRQKKASRSRSFLDRLGSCFSSKAADSNEEDRQPFDPPRPKTDHIEDKEEEVPRPDHKKPDSDHKKPDSDHKKPDSDHKKPDSDGAAPGAMDGKSRDKDNPVRQDSYRSSSFENLPIVMEYSSRLESGSYEEIKQMCLDKNAIYVDPDFAANSSTLYTGGPVYGVQWKRPWQITRNPVFIKEGVTYPDVYQGSVGDCWFIATLAALAASPQKELLKRNIPTDQTFTKGQYCGAFRFFFWRYGKWVEVIIDDRLPTYGGSLIYAHNKADPNEFWAPLVEKAFAKFHGNYNALEGGRLHESMVDICGGLSEMVELRDAITDDKLINLLHNCQKMNSFMGAAIFKHANIPGEREIKTDTGLYEGHAYSVINIKQINNEEYSTTLLHLRNPWGKGEWNGAWSDRSPQWHTLSLADKKSTYKTRDDGEFWISVTDFRRYFDELELCHLTPDALTQEIADNLDLTQWEMTEYYGSWVRGVSAGGPPVSFTSKSFWSNPQYRIKLADATEKTTVVISLFQTDDRLRNEGVSIGFVIFQLKDGRKPLPSRITAGNYYEFYPRLVETSGPYWPYRERTVRFEMDPAEHIVVPCTYRPGQQAEFYLRVFAEGKLLPEDKGDESKPVVTEEIDTVIEPETVEDPSLVAVKEAFADKSGARGSIDVPTMAEVLKAGFQAGDERDHQGFNIETCRCLLSLSDTDGVNGSIDKETLLKVWSDLSTWRGFFQLVDKDDNLSVDISELANLFVMADLTIGPKTLKAIMNRYGDKQRRIYEEDFLQIFCKVIKAQSRYSQLKSTRKIYMTLDEWLSTLMKI